MTAVADPPPFDSPAEKTRADPVFAAAVEAHWAGLCPIPCAADGSKRPFGLWMQYITTRSTMVEIESWFGSTTRAGLGLVCGVVSGGLEMLEFEGRAMAEGLFGRFVERCEQAGVGRVLDRIIDGYGESTPSGGIHLPFRVDGPCLGNTKLARRRDPNDPTVIHVLIETRGQGGFVVIAPSHGVTHPTGLPWTLDTGSLSTIATVTVAERDALYDVARTFDEMEPKKEPSAPKSNTTTVTPNAQQTALRPSTPLSEKWMGQVCADLAERPWADVLGPYGFTFHHEQGGEVYWTRPDKDPALGHSATTNAKGTDRLIPFSSSMLLEAWDGTGMATSYDRLDVIAAYEHGGDRIAAGRALAGRDEPRTRPPNVDPVTGQIGEDVPDEPVSGDVGSDGATFILDESTDLEARWGDGSNVLWAHGESMMLVGPTGVGKTTLTGQVVGGLIGVIPHVLGYTVRPAVRVLYLAMDRPRQIRRALRRLFGEEHREALSKHLYVRPGPLPADLAKDPTQLVALARRYGCDVIVLDSLKDAAVKLSDDETGGSVNRAIQLCNVADIDVLVLHHQRKGQDGKKPTTLADVYGSTWLTAGTGSVVLLWGDAGSELIELTHLKQPADSIGPLNLEHDHHAGTTRITRGFDALAFLRHRPNGATVSEAAQAEHSGPQKSGDKNWKRTERRLRALVRDGLAEVDGQDRSGGQFAEARYHAAGTLRHRTGV